MATDVEHAEIDAPASPDAKREPEVNKLFRWVMKEQGSDLHLKVGQPPMMRLRGDIKRSNARPLTQEDMERLLLPALSPRQRKILGSREQPNARFHRLSSRISPESADVAGKDSRLMHNRVGARLTCRTFRQHILAQRLDL